MRLLRANCLAGLLAAVILSAVAVPCSATIFYVDNRQGSDGFDGRSPRPVSEQTGPTRTIARALKHAEFGDTIIIANTGVPYYEGVSLVGRSHSGFSNRPFTIVGNGAVIDGSRPVQPESWRRVRKGLWRMTPWRKGHFQLILDDKPLPEFRPEKRPDALPEIPKGQWMAWKGAIYYQGDEFERPALRPFRYAAHSVGVTLYEVRNVQIVDLNLRHFRLDGVNAHDRAQFVRLENVTTTGNGRSGMAVGGNSAVVIRNSEATGNRLHSVLITELGAVKLEDSKLSQPPTVVKE